MKTYRMAAICLLASICFAGACNDDASGPEKENYPVTTLVGERTCSGTIDWLHMPPLNPTDPVLPGLVLGLKTAEGEFILKFDEQWYSDETITVGGVVYTVGDKVEIEGTLRKTQATASDAYFELEIQKIRKSGPSE